MFDDRPVAIHGPNGAGKTNLLEAISLLSPGRGMRRAAAEARERTKDLRARARKAEQEMGRLAEQRSAIDRAMFDPDHAEEPYRDKPMTDLMKKRGEIEKKLGAAEAEWLAASEALERTEAAE